MLDPLTALLGDLANHVLVDGSAGSVVVEGGQGVGQAAEVVGEGGEVFAGLLGAVCQRSGRPRSA